MKITWLVLLLACASVSHAQITSQRTWTSEDSGYVTTAWTEVTFESGEYYKIVRVDIDHDTTAYARRPYLQYAFDYDTSATQLMILRPGESIRHDGLGILRLFMRASADSLPARVVLYR
jgi:hypothetical protein